MKKLIFHMLKHGPEYLKFYRCKGYDMVRVIDFPNGNYTLDLLAFNNSAEQMAKSEQCNYLGGYPYPLCYGLFEGFRDAAVTIIRGAFWYYEFAEVDKGGFKAWMRIVNKNGSVVEKIKRLKLKEKGRMELLEGKRKESEIGYGWGISTEKLDERSIIMVEHTTPRKGRRRSYELACIPLYAEGWSSEEKSKLFDRPIEVFEPKAQSNILKTFKDCLFNAKRADSRADTWVEDDRALLLSKEGLGAGSSLDAILKKSQEHRRLLFKESEAERLQRQREEAERVRERIAKDEELRRIRANYPDLFPSDNKKLLVCSDDALQDTENKV